jgi:hypothetical protein
MTKQQRGIIKQFGEYAKRVIAYCGPGIEKPGYFECSLGMTGGW